MTNLTNAAKHIILRKRNHTRLHQVRQEEEYISYVRPSHTTTETAKKSSYCPYTLQLFSNLQQFFQQFSMWATFFFRKISAASVIVFKGPSVMCLWSFSDHFEQWSENIPWHRFNRWLREGGSLQYLTPVMRIDFFFNFIVKKGGGCVATKSKRSKTVLLNLPFFLKE